MEDTIYRQILKYRQMPRGLFLGSPDKVGALMQAIAATGIEAKNRRAISICDVFNSHHY